MMNVRERQGWFSLQESVDPRLGVWFRVREVAWEMEEGKGRTAPGVRREAHTA